MGEVKCTGGEACLGDWCRASRKGAGHSGRYAVWVAVGVIEMTG